MAQLIDHLTSAVSQGDPREVKRLLQAGVDPNAMDTNGYTALHIAAIHYRLKEAQLLLAHGADINGPSTDRGDRFFDYLLGTGSAADPLGVLALKAGAATDHVDEDGKGVLHRACRNGLEETARMLLGMGFDPNVRDSKGRAPLHEAARCSVPICLMLFEAGADVDAEDLRGRRPLHEAVANNWHSTAYALIALGASAHGVQAAQQKLDDQLALSPVASAMLTLDPAFLVHALRRNPGYDLEQLKQEVPSSHGKRFKAMHDVLRSWVAQRAAQEALDGDAQDLRPPHGARP